MEPGRFIVGNAGVLLTRVLYRKRSGGKDFLDHRRRDDGAAPPLALRCVSSHRGRAAATAQSMTADVVGPVCESGDFLALDREMDDVAAGRSARRATTSARTAT